MVKYNLKRFKNTLRWDDYDPETDTLNHQQITDRCKTMEYLHKGSFWLPNHSMSEVFDLKARYLSSSTAAFQGYLFAKSKGYRLIAAYLLSSHRQFKNHYSKEFS